MFNNDSMNYYSTSTLKSALLKSYAWMAIALSITAVVSYGLYVTNALMILLSTMPFLFMLFVIAPFILSIAFGVSMARSTSSYRHEGYVSALCHLYGCFTYFYWLCI